MPEAVTPEVQEVTLADLLRTLWRRKWVLLVAFLLVFTGGAAYTFLKTPQYQSRSTLVALEQQDIIQRWLESRQAAEWVADHLGDPLLSRLFPGDWSASSGGWRGEPPTAEKAGAAVAQHVKVAANPPVPGRTDRTLRVVATLADAGLARDVANAYVSSLDVIKPQLQNVTESALFQQFYDGQNAQDARRQAHTVALEREYWIVVDPAYAATEPSSPNVPVNLALAGVLGLLLGVFAAFTAQWVGNYRVSSRPPAVPPSMAAAPPPPSAPPAPPTSPAGRGREDASFRYRGR
jgi:hypothetical protein